jgi:hypothetical protein
MLGPLVRPSQCATGLSEVRELILRGHQNRDIRVGIFSSSEEILLRGARPGGVALQSASASEAKVSECAQRDIFCDASVAASGDARCSLRRGAELQRRAFGRLFGVDADCD